MKQILIVSQIYRLSKFKNVELRRIFGNEIELKFLLYKKQALDRLIQEIKQESPYAITLQAPPHDQFKIAQELHPIYVLKAQNKESSTTKMPTEEFKAFKLVQTNGTLRSLANKELA